MAVDKYGNEKATASHTTRYGYVYPCQEPGGGRDGGAVCLLKPTEFRGAPCSDAAGSQKEFAELMRRARPQASFPTKGHIVYHAR